MTALIPSRHSFECAIPDIREMFFQNTGRQKGRLQACGKFEELRKHILGAFGVETAAAGGVIVSLSEGAEFYSGLHEGVGKCVGREEVGFSGDFGVTEVEEEVV